MEDKLELPRCKEILAVNHEAIPLIGQINVNLKFNNFELTIVVQIVEGLGLDLVFGRDEMSKHILNINYNKHSSSHIK